MESAEQCLLFQQESGFRYLIVPTRFCEGMPSNYIDLQASQFADPFVNCYRALTLERPLFLQLILTDQMLRDERFRTDVLNWVTGIPELSGIYLIYYVYSRRKQIDNIEFLLGLLTFIAALKQAGMFVFVGYCNTEALLLLCADPDVITIGCYENLRMFSLRAFEGEETQMRGPNARVYIPRLLQWIEYQYLGAIRRVVTNIDEYVEDNRYRIKMFNPSYNWHFAKPDPYKHYFIAFSRQLDRLCQRGGRDRIEAVKDELERAAAEFASLESQGIVFELDSSGRHLPAWRTAINLFEREFSG